MSRSNRSSDRRGFTLVELLVVITIIGILVSLLVPTLAAAVKKSREAAISLEIKQLQMAMESFKKERKTNSYPPDFSKDHGENTAVNRANVLDQFVRRNFRNTRPGYVTQWGGAANNPNELDPSEALYFWLALSQKNPESPLARNAANTGWVFFEFKADRLVDKDNDGWPEYLPPHGDEAPYIYFESSRYPNANPPSAKPSGYDTDLYNGGTGYPNAGSVRPYYRQLPTLDSSGVPTTPDPQGVYQASSGFQIIGAGYDGVFGTSNYKAFPTGVGFEEEDLDNIASFSEGRLDIELD